MKHIWNYHEIILFILYNVNVLLCQTVGLRLLQAAVSQVLGISLLVYILKSERNKRTETVYSYSKRKEETKSLSYLSFSFRLKKQLLPPKAQQNSCPTLQLHHLLHAPRRRKRRQLKHLQDAFVADVPPLRRRGFRGGRSGVGNLWGWKPRS